MRTTISSASRVVSGAVLALGSLCCSNDGKEALTLETLPTGPGWSVEQFCEAYVERMDAQCAWRTSCCTDLRDPSLFIPDSCGVTIEQCEADILAILDGGPDWNGTVAERCVQALVTDAPEEPCSGVPERPYAQPVDINRIIERAACATLFTGRKMAGSPCGFHHDCISGLICRFQQGNESVCGKVPQLDDSCHYDGGCSSGLTCVEEDDQVWTCHEDLPDVQICYGSDLSCPAGTRCFVAEAALGQPQLSSGTCRPPLDVGEHCSTNPPQQCAKDARCNDVEVCELRKANSDPCTDSEECLGQCDPEIGVCVSICGGTWLAE